MPKPPSRRSRLPAAPLVVLAAGGLAGQAAAAPVPPERLVLQARIDAVRAGLAEVAAVAAVDAASGWQLAQASNWTNWPKWSKWSNWANK